jgi:phosphoglucosamine mutase
MMMPEMAMRLGRAYALYLTENGIPRPRLVMGRDTRRSGQMLESAVIAGLTSSGASVSNLGVAPTPEISFAVRSSGFHGGVVISASHNPAEYNGIKFLDSSGTKLSDEQEIAIEEYMEDSFIDEWRPTGASIGTYDSFEQMHELKDCGIFIHGIKDLNSPALSIVLMVPLLS